MGTKVDPDARAKCQCPLCGLLDPEMGCPYGLSRLSLEYMVCFSCRHGLHAGVKLGRDRPDGGA